MFSGSGTGITLILFAVVFFLGAALGEFIFGRGHRHL